jgi:entericidin A
MTKPMSMRAVLMTLVAGVLLSGCQTVKGLGRDIESVGQAGSEAINDD